MDEAVAAVHRALKAMKHRGDAEAKPKVLIYENTVLGHVRLPIIDLSNSSDQPMIRGETAVVFVGEIFNFREFSRLALSDTQVLLDEFNWGGVEAFHRFDGFWSAVFVNREGPTVVTDYLSQKPLYFDEDTMLVVSEPDAALAAVPSLSQNLDPVYRANVLKWGYDPTGGTPYAGLVQLPAGSTLTIDQGVKQTGYWDWQRVPEAPSLREALTQATSNRLVGDRAVSLLLSGGLDSSIVLGILTKELARDNVAVLHTPNNEDGYLHQVLQFNQVHWSRSKVMAQSQVSLNEALRAHQVPVDLGSMIPQVKLAKAVSELGFVVCMSGDGADELFGGYRRAKEYDSQASDTFMELPYYHLPRLDRIMMRSTVELRSPFLAPSVIRYAMNLPWKARTEKQALKNTFMDLVPDSVLNRSKHPLKSPEVINGGLQWRQHIIDEWEKMLHDAG